MSRCDDHEHTITHLRTDNGTKMGKEANKSVKIEIDRLLSDEVGTPHVEGKREAYCNLIL